MRKFWLLAISAAFFYSNFCGLFSNIALSAPSTDKVFGIESSDLVQHVATLADLKILADSLGLTSSSKEQVVYLEGRIDRGDGGEGLFRWDGSDLANKVDADRQSGIYIAPDSDPTGKSGAWVRIYSGDLQVAWFGILPGSDVTSEIASTFSTVASLGINNVYFPGEGYLISSLIVVPGNITIKGESGKYTFKVPESAYSGRIVGIFSTVFGLYPPNSIQYRWGDHSAIKKNVRFINCGFDMNRGGASLPSISAIRLEDAEFSSVENCLFKDNTTNGYPSVEIVRSESIVITGNQFEGVTGIRSTDSKYVLIGQNKISGSIGTQIEVNVGSYVTIRDNEVNGTVWSVSSIGINSPYSVVENNRILNQNHSGITVGHVGSDYYGNEWVANNSIIAKNIIIGGNGKHGILVQNAPGSTITENLIKDISPNGLDGTSPNYTAAAISARSSDPSKQYTEDLIISKNKLLDVGRGISLSGNGNTLISGNFIKISNTAKSIGTYYAEGIIEWPYDDKYRAVLRIEGNTFLNGSRGVQTYRAHTLISGNSFTNNSQYSAVIIDGGCTLSGNTAHDSGPFRLFYNKYSLSIRGNIYYHSLPDTISEAIQVIGGQMYTPWEKISTYGNINDGAKNTMTFKNVLNAPSETFSTGGLFKQNPRGTYTLEGLPTSPLGLSSGDLWNNNGVITIVP